VKEEDAIVRGIRKDPSFFLQNILGFTPWSKQLEIIESVRDNPRTAVRSANGVGKTAIAARTVLWFLAAHPKSVVVTTAPTWKQVETQLWREMAVAFEAGREFFQILGQPEIFKTDLTIAPNWYATGISTEKPERFSGFHSAHILLVVDEASGVADDIFEAAEGFLTSKNARVLLISNPTRLSGEFYRAFHRDASLWHRIQVGIMDSPNFSGEKVPEDVRLSLPDANYPVLMERKYGRESALFAVRVLGEFPRSQDDAVCKLDMVEQAQYRELEPGLPVVVSCDVARMGGDETVIAVRRGNQVRIVDAYAGKDLTFTIGRLLQIERDLYADTGCDLFHVLDYAGLGVGVFDALRERSEFPVFGFNSSHRARDARDYPNRRSEAWFEFAEQFLPVIDLDPDPQLLEDLVAPVFKPDSAGRRVVEAKDETRKRLSRSPDRADAVLMAFAFNPTESVEETTVADVDRRALSAGVLTQQF
jgi:phage terminase large subunit